MGTLTQILFSFLFTNRGNPDLHYGMNLTASLSAAETIRQQIGSRALYMIGAKNLLADAKSLTFKIGRNDNGVTHIRVTLSPLDLYTVEFLRCVGTRPVVTVAERDMIYADSLCSVIETETGLRTSL